jgi:hypothetical protein
MTAKKVIEYAFFSLLSFLGTVSVSYIHQISDSMEKLTKSVVQLNSKIEVLAEKTMRADDVLKDHEVRLRGIEVHRR